MITAWFSPANRVLLILLSLISLAETVGKFFHVSMFFILGGALGLLGTLQILSKLIRRIPSD
jgi:predicted benzoate:H+ symporter BenE